MGFKKGDPRPANAGRKKGTRNKATLTLKEALQAHQGEFIQRLLALAKHKDPNIRLRALQTCLDRGWGKAPQPLTGEDGKGPAVQEIRWVLVNDTADGAPPRHTNSASLPTTH